jgi:hypothetical protein
MRIIELIQDHQYIVLAVTVPLMLFYGRVLVRALFAGPGTNAATAPVRRLPPRPVPGAMVKPPATPVPPTGKQEVLPSSLDQGAAGHQQRGAAKTVKIPVAPAKGTDGSAPTDIMPPPARVEPPRPTTASGQAAPAKPASDDDQALDSLFAGAKAEAAGVPGESKTGAIRRKASRMEELGFHPGIHPEAAPPAGEPPKPIEPPRSQTAELTSILERIDKFLAEDQPAKPATDKIEKPAAPAAPAPAAPPAPVPAAKQATPLPAVPETVKPAAPAAEKPDPNKKTQPLWAQPDAMDEDADKAAKSKPGEPDKPADNGQQRLF